MKSNLSTSSSRLLRSALIAGATTLSLAPSSSAQHSEDIRCKILGLMHIQMENNKNPDSIDMATLCTQGNDEIEVMIPGRVILLQNKNGVYPMPFDTTPYVQIDDGQPSISFEDEGERKLGVMPKIDEEIYSFRNQLARLGEWQR